MVRYAAGSILSFSTFPLVLTAWVGLITTMLGLALGAQTLYNYLAGKAVSGFTTVILLQVLFAGLTMLSIGMVAAYLVTVLTEVKGRPLYLIRSPRADVLERPFEGRTAEAGRSMRQ